MPTPTKLAPFSIMRRHVATSPDMEPAGTPAAAQSSKARLSVASTSGCCAQSHAVSGDARSRGRRASVRERAQARAVPQCCRGGPSRRQGRSGR